MPVASAELVSLQRSAAMLTPGQSMPVERDVLYELCGEMLEARQPARPTRDRPQSGRGEGAKAAIGQAPPARCRRHAERRQFGDNCARAAAMVGLAPPEHDAQTAKNHKTKPDQHFDELPSSTLRVRRNPGGREI